ncbi:hypothetical protein [Adlercreutzia faecimuris]|uniref:DUF559 domain-containing protein n=1 Tax=Adlercreutzia faecimuris TaxID=2897341 RepID=A0ABS9WFU5_9ACTN|nr:hypothetical protein [Adlercreutzia sp. JBNU-10]MCI2241728.1 hypothetical protein [Adlercreutzia sp. JBNU-10]
MSIFLSHDTALEHLRSPAAERDFPLCYAAPRRDVPQGAALADAGLHAFGIHGRPYHVLVADAAARGKSRLVRSHVCAAAYPPGSFRRLARDLYVSSPELCFLQMAPSLPFGRLVLLGMELCGGYALDPDSLEGFRCREALSSAAALRRTTRRLAGVKGVKAARFAVRFVADGALSPMEAAVVLLLCAPTSRGGYGLELPALNAEVRLTRSAGRWPASRLCDLYWPARRLAIEYDSNRFHVGAERIARDAARRAQLAREGVEVLTLTWDQVRHAGRFHEVAVLVAMRLRGGFRCSRSDWEARRAELRRQVLPGRDAG